MNKDIFYIEIKASFLKEEIIKKEIKAGSKEKPSESTFKTVYNQCSSCLSNGSFKKECYNCSGRGKARYERKVTENRKCYCLPGTWSCTSCRGFGYYPYEVTESYTDVCQSCDGAGKITKNCSECKAGKKDLGRTEYLKVYKDISNYHLYNYPISCYPINEAEYQKDIDTQNYQMAIFQDWAPYNQKISLPFGLDFNTIKTFIDNNPPPYNKADTVLKSIDNIKIYYFEKPEKILADKIEKEKKIAEEKRIFDLLQKEAKIKEEKENKERLENILKEKKLQNKLFILQLTILYQNINSIEAWKKFEKYSPVNQKNTFFSEIEKTLFPSYSGFAAPLLKRVKSIKNGEFGGVKTAIDLLLFLCCYYLSLSLMESLTQSYAHLRFSKTSFAFIDLYNQTGFLCFIFKHLLAIAVVTAGWKLRELRFFWHITAIPLYGLGLAFFSTLLPSIFMLNSIYASGAFDFSSSMKEAGEISSLPYLLIGTLGLVINEVIFIKYFIYFDPFEIDIAKKVLKDKNKVLAVKEMIKNHAIDLGAEK